MAEYLMPEPATIPCPDTARERHIATYEVIHEGDSWIILHEGKRFSTLETRMAAFETVATAARTSILAGHGVNIKLPHEITRHA
jgi:hypothetical protein